MSKEGAIEILRGTRKLLEDPYRWTARLYARDVVGNNCSPHSPNAVCWCLEGAMRKIAGHTGMTSYMIAVNALQEPCLSKRNDDLYNDNDHPALLALIDNGIARLSGQRMRLPKET